MIERGSRAIYEMTRGASIPGVVHGLEVRHVGTGPLAEAVLRAALNDPAPEPSPQVPGQIDIYEAIEIAEQANGRL